MFEESQIYLIWYFSEANKKLPDESNVNCQGYIFEK